MKLEDIGFYTLTDERAANPSLTSPLYRCELILTSRCNFKCPYCRGVKEADKGDIPVADAHRIVGMWASHGLKNIRFSGGEPTLWGELEGLVKFTRSLGIQRIAVSSNGSADLRMYLRLVQAGVTDFSISLDSCCSSTGNKMAGRSDVWETVVSNISTLSKIVYTTVGVVLTQDNHYEVNEIIKFASGLGVSDIRVIPAAQISKELSLLVVDRSYLDTHPILKYRYQNFIEGKGVRGLSTEDNPHCPLVMDDMAVLNGNHYPCIIYMREQGSPIGKVGRSMERIREERAAWARNHNCFEDPICKNNCLDVCVEYNNRVRELKETPNEQG